MCVRVAPGLLTYLQLLTSPQRRRFKHAVGQANHFLITIFIGLDAVSNGTAQPGSTFSTTWNPKNPKASAQRSRAFVHRATLSLLIDSVDAYVIECMSRPELIQDAAAVQKLREAGDTTARFDALAELSGQAKSEPWALVNVARMWRHRLVHKRSRARLRPLVRKTLLESSADIHTTYQGLDVNEMIRHAESGAPPRFKEAAAMFRAAHLLVESVDEVLIAKLDLMGFCEAVLCDYVVGVEPGERVARVANVWGKDPLRRERTVETLLREAGLSVAPGPSTAAAASATVAALANRSVAEVRERLNI